MTLNLKYPIDELCYTDQSFSFYYEIPYKCVIILIKSTTKHERKFR